MRVKIKNNDKNNIINDKFNKMFENINTNKLFIGLAMLFLNIGSRYIELKLTKSQEAIIKNVAREVLIFSIAFIGTRDIIAALIITTLFIIFSKYIFNEKSKFNILPEKYKKLNDVLDSNHDGVISQEEIDKAIEILKKANNQENLDNKINMLNNMKQ